jgi:hypothetical protein
MQGIETAGERPSAQEQWKNNAQNNGKRRKYRRALTIAWSYQHPTKTIARRREAPGAHVQD